MQGKYFTLHPMSIVKQLKFCNEIDLDKIIKSKAKIPCFTINKNLEGKKKLMKMGLLDSSINIVLTTVVGRS